MSSIEDSIILPLGDEQEGAESETTLSCIEVIRVPLGRVCITPGAQSALEEAGQNALQVLARHYFCDWGELDTEDWERNNHALEHGLRLLSSYRLRNGMKVWVITESDRSSTTVLTPEEY